MLNVLSRGQTVFATIPEGAPLPDDAVWIELIEPTRSEELAVETMLGVQLPTREEMAEIEVSSRLYEEDGAAAAQDVQHRGSVGGEGVIAARCA